jgi:hypothetical protein
MIHLDITGYYMTPSNSYSDGMTHMIHDSFLDSLLGHYCDSVLVVYES